MTSWLLQPVAAARVAWLRTLVYLFVPVDVLVTTPWVARHDTAPPALYRPVLLDRLLHLPAPTSLLVHLIEAALLVTALVAATGRAPRLLLGAVGAFADPVRGEGAASFAVGRVTRAGALFGYVAVDTQRWFRSPRVGLRLRRWSETRRRYRLDLLSDWDEGFLTTEDEADLASGRFQFRGEVLTYEELAGDERRTVVSQRFSDWA